MTSEEIRDLDGALSQGKMGGITNTVHGTQVPPPPYLLFLISFLFLCLF